MKNTSGFNNHRFYGLFTPSIPLAILVGIPIFIAGSCKSEYVIFVIHIYKTMVFQKEFLKGFIFNKNSLVFGRRTEKN